MNGRTTSSSCARSSAGDRTAATAFRWRGWPACRPRVIARAKEILSGLERDELSRGGRPDAVWRRRRPGDAAARAVRVDSRSRRSAAATDRRRLKALDVDDTTPRQALELLAELKKLPRTMQLECARGPTVVAAILRLCVLLWLLRHAARSPAPPTPTSSSSPSAPGRTTLDPRQGNDETRSASAQLMFSSLMDVGRRPARRIPRWPSGSTTRTR